MRTIWRRLTTTLTTTCALVALAPSTAGAAGLNIPENTAGALARGGTSTGLLGTAYSLEFNPAGLALVHGLDVRIDARMINHAVTFKREAFGGTEFNRVSNQAGPFIAPNISVAYSPHIHKDAGIAVGFGLHGPPGVGRYSYADPKAMFESGFGPPDVDQRAGQRYSLIESESQMLMPSLAFAFRAGRFSGGMTLQAVRASISFAQTIGATPDDGAGGDAYARLAVTDAFTPAAVLGAAYQLTPAIRLAASVRPRIRLEAEGTMDVEGIGALDGQLEQLSNGAKLALNLPTIARVGAAFRHKALSGAAEVIYEGWSANAHYELDPDVSIRNNSNGDVISLSPRLIEKGWQDSYGVRLGGSYDVLPRATNKVGLELHGGWLYETNAVPSRRQAIDLVSGDRTGVSLGATVGFGNYSVTVAGMGYIPVRLEITDSEVVRSHTEPDAPARLIGNGVYTSNIWIGAVSFAYTGLGSVQ